MTLFPDCQKASQNFPHKRKTEFKTFCAGACTWHKILIRLQVWKLFVLDEQLVRAAGCQKLAEKPEGISAKFKKATVR